MENFAKDFMVRLDGKVSNEDMVTILQELQMFTSNYDIQKKETNIVLYDNQLPDCYKVYMVAKKLEGLSEGT